MASILFLLPEGGVRRWHCNAAAAMRAAGHSVSARMIAGHAGADWPDWLARAEDRLFAIETPRAGADALWTGPLAATAGELFDIAFSFGVQPPEDVAPVILEPVIEGASGTRGLLGALVDRRSPKIGWRLSGGGMIVDARTAIVSPHVLTQGRDHALARLASLAPKAIENLSRDHPVSGDFSPGRRATDLATATHLATEVARGALRKLRGGRLPMWNVGWRQLPEDGGLLADHPVALDAYSWLPVDPARFVADPFPFVHEGRLFVFVEELPFATWRGYISVFEIDAQGKAGSLRPVLERPYHLSYPSVFAEAGQVWMIPETGANRTIELYRADPFPDRWVPERVLIEDIDAADATVFRHNGRWWIMAAMYGGGASSWDAMGLFHAERLEGPWQPHPLNPVVTDPACARPAGWVIRTSQGLIRPAQDCVYDYGAALALRRITRLDPYDYAEEPIARIVPPAGARGLHTLNHAGGYEVIDALF